MQMRWLIATAWILVACGVASCAATGLVYQRLDWLAAWRLDDYVTLHREQAAQFKRDFSELWRWHRNQELPLYARDFREMAGVLDSAVSREQVADYVGRFQAHTERVMARTVSGLCGVVQSLDDAQVREILDEVEEDTEEFARKYVNLPEDELRRNSEKRTAKWIKRWTGPLNPRQQELLREWGGKRRSTGADWLEYRKQWRGQLEQALSQRGSSASCEQFKPLFVTPMELRNETLAADLAHNELLWQQLMADVIGVMDRKQHDHAQRKLLEFADQLEQLVKTPVP